MLLCYLNPSMSLLVMVLEKTAIKRPKNSLYKSRAELLVTITALLGNLSISSLGAHRTKIDVK